MSLLISEIVIITIVTLIIAKLMKYHIDRWQLYRLAAQFQGPPAYPIFGNALFLFDNTREIYNQFIKWTKIYASPTKIWVLNKLYFIAFDADQVKAIILSTKTLERDNTWNYIRPWIGNGLLTAPVDIWRIHRKMIVPTFHIKILQTFIKSFNEQSEVLIKQMKIHEGKGEFELFEYVSRCTLDFICSTAMSMSINAQLNITNQYVESVRKLIELMISRAFTFYLNPDWIYYRTKYGAEHEKYLKHLHRVTDEVIKKKRQGIEKENMNIQGAGGQSLRTFLDYIMELSDNGKYFTDEEVRDEVNTFMFAGSETSARSSCFTMLMLANFSDVQQKVYDELYDIFGDALHDEHLEITLDHLNRMEYLERVIKESLRLYPIAPFVIRQVTADLDIGGKVLPKGSSVAVAIIALHRDEKYWEKPFEFHPDRFLPESSSARHPYCYIPFYGGPRNCLGNAPPPLPVEFFMKIMKYPCQVITSPLGMKYAMMSMKTMISTIIRHYVLIKEDTVPIENIELEVRGGLQPVKPFAIRIENRMKSK